MAIVGAGDTAAEATYLANICTKVTMLVRRDVMRASKAMQHRVNNRNIEVLFNTEVDEVLGEQVVEGSYGNNTTEKNRNPITTCLSPYCPNTDIFKGQLDMDDAGYLITEEVYETNPGVFASGDVQDKEYRQAVTAGTAVWLPRCVLREV